MGLSISGEFFFSLLRLICTKANPSLSLSLSIYTYILTKTKRFEAFDEPWKVQFNEKGKEWEDKWGLMDIDRNLKPGLKIPDCGGQTAA